jgi:serine/threonine protein kinase
MIDWIGKTLGRVQIESLIARGGMAEVYLGTHTTLHREVAVKILRQHYEDDPRPLQQFEREARAVAKLRHPNIVQVFDFATVEDQPYIVMEYISGPSLSKYLTTLHSKDGRLGLPLISRLLTGVANALQYAHESGVIHRDVKPGNILLTSRSIRILPGETVPLDFEPVLTDFGLVRILDSSRQTTTGQTAGTPAYMSPEQAMGLATDGRTDIYSLGIVLYEMLSGNVPFDGETTLSVLLKHLNEAPMPIPGLSPALQSVLDRALAKNADDRFDEPKEFAAAFNRALEGTSDANTLLTITRVADSATANTAVPVKRRKHWMQAVLAGALIVLVSVSVLFNGMPPAVNGETPTTSLLSDTPTLVVPISLGPTGILHFQDGNAILDQVVLIAQAMPAPPAGSRYEVWLVSGEKRLPLGILSVDRSGRGELTFNDPQDQNLLASYQRVEIAIEPNGDSDPNGSAGTAYAFTLPEAGLGYMRGLLVSFPGTPEQVGLIQGLTGNAKLMDEAARHMVSAYEAGNEAGTKDNAETIMNLLAGDQSQDYKDWNGDGQITDPGDGYGLLLNGDHFGYIQAVYSHADYAVNSPGASRNMILNGESVMVCTQNLARWAPELHNHLSTILSAVTLSDMDQGIARSAELTDQMLNGVDLNENELIEPVSGECGVLLAYEYTYRMADMPLLPVNSLGIPVTASETITPSQTASSPLIVTPTKRDDESRGTVAPPPATSRPRPTQRPKPTKKKP